ncbi:unnamed protein product [Gongylonema pulchrum]|uniref:Agenet domain-containing protein n=1 Tax=Gongylonema pulchrum TaxID=637853 RepID=A0A183CYM2_9BILA|nr:unnamed protein product [Gongylonema pulchrum]
MALQQDSCHANEEGNEGDDGRTVHLIYSEYDSAPSETDVEVIEGPQHYWWTSSKSHGKEVCLVYSDYDEPSSETSVNMDNFFHDQKIQGREVRLIYSEYEEPPSETEVEYDGRPWCSIFGNQNPQQLFFKNTEPEMRRFHVYSWFALCGRFLSLTPFLAIYLPSSST